MGHGGRKVVEDGVEYYEIDGEAEFQAPFEFPVGPMPEIEIGKPVSHEFLVVGAKEAVRWRRDRRAQCRADSSSRTGGSPALRPIVPACIH